MYSTTRSICRFFGTLYVNGVLKGLTIYKIMQRYYSTIDLLYSIFKSFGTMYVNGLLCGTDKLSQQYYNLPDILYNLCYFRCRLEILNNLLEKFMFKHLVMLKNHGAINHSKKVCLHRSYTRAWKLSPDYFTPSENNPPPQI